jgi:hypothetical protein
MLRREGDKEMRRNGQEERSENGREGEAQTLPPFYKMAGMEATKSELRRHTTVVHVECRPRHVESNIASDVVLEDVVSSKAT